MRKVVTVDATFLKNGYGGVLVFATAQDPNRHHYPLAFGVLDGENKDSWSWFFEMFKTVVPDSSELVFMSDRNGSLINAIANVFPKAHHAHCIWHLAQNVKGHVSNVNKEIVQWRFMDIARIYTVPEFDAEYSAFKNRYPSAAKYLEESSEKEKWARCWFPGDRYNIDTSNVVESMNSVFKDARKYSLIPLVDTIIKKTADWFNEHRKETVRGSSERKLVPLVENLCMTHGRLPGN
ncbi:PREDICTED: protein FAR1-RELATED SEQUENCE 5-like [Brassica oleracea var. oleracea]|uniref:protein FAR1-RELATED SEQUENCE 5-like n=1 Tax=Brassica oleracea var. oleracea TaxID=109376 RepID=UPI0006A73B50|nr:PREDICTED: protein FAR1-RELATED SEQUENCE 5-like [Brassica oleracea var. oleracea]